MKKLVFSLICATVMAAIMISCGQSSSEQNSEPTTAAEKAPAADTTQPQTSLAAFSIAPVLSNYLELKNALVADDGEAAANAGNKLLSTLKGIDMKTVPADKHKDYMDIAGDAEENAEHIGGNAKNIGHQREHFASLSKDMDDLITLFEAPQSLYRDFCPMYDDNKGAIWISETKEIRNPYYGKKMLSCGAIKKEIKK